MVGELGSHASGIELVEVPRLAAAIKRLQDANFDLVLLDLSLPDSQGVATVARLKDARPNVPIVVLASQDDDNIATDALRRGAQDYLVKDQIDRRMLLRAIRHAIERKMIEAQLQTQIGRQAALRAVELAMTSTLDVEGVLNILLDKIIELFPRYAASVRLLDEQTGNLGKLLGRNLIAGSWRDKVTSGEQSLRVLVMQTRKPLVVSDILSYPAAFNREFMRVNGLVSYLGIPLIAKDELVGVLSVYAKERHDFGGEVMEFFNTLGNQAAVAIHNSRLYERAKTANERQAVLHDINLALTSTLDLQSVMNILLEKIDRIFPGLAITVRLLDQSTEQLEAFACRNLDEKAWKETIPAKGMLLTHAVMTGRKPLALVDVQSDPRVRSPEFQRENNLISFLGVPLIARGVALGVLSIYSKERHEFSYEEIEFFSTLGGQASIAIQNSQLYEKTKTANERQTVLREINLALASTLNLQSVLDILLDKVIQLFPQVVVVVRLRNTETGYFDALFSRNVDVSDWKSTSPRGEGGFLSAVVEAQKPLVITDVQSDARAHYPETLRQRGLVSYLGVPLIAKDELLGVVSLYTRERHEFSNEEVEFFSTLAGQAAVAIQNSRLYEKTKTANDRQAALREINSAITATLDLPAILKVLLDKIAQLLPGYAVTVRLAQAESGAWEGVACMNIDEAEWRSSAARSGTTVADAVVAARKPLAVANVQTDPMVKNHDFMRHNELVSYAGVPMIVQDEVIGVLGFFTKVGHEFDSDELELLVTLAGQAAIAIHNSQLYERLKRANESLEQTLEVKSMLTGVIAHELKTPIQVIMGTASLLADGMCGELNEEQGERVGKIEAGADEMLRLIESSLDMARLEQGKMPLVVTEIRVRGLLAELESEFSEAFAKKGLGLEVNPAPAGSTIKTDRVKLKEVLRNLIDNARKYTTQGKVVVEFAVRGNDRVEFTVGDTGIGIKKELLPKIFELFYQVDPSQKEHASAGMGLNIVKRLVAALSGEIDVASEVSKGTSFRINLPRTIA